MDRWQRSGSLMISLRHWLTHPGFTLPLDLSGWGTISPLPGWAVFWVFCFLQLQAFWLLHVILSTPSPGSWLLHLYIERISQFRTVSLWRENMEDLVTRMRGGREGWPHLLHWVSGQMVEERGSVWARWWLVSLWAFRSHLILGLKNKIYIVSPQLGKKKWHRKILEGQTLQYLVIYGMFRDDIYFLCVIFSTSQTFFNFLKFFIEG